MLVDTVPNFQTEGNFILNENGILITFDGARSKWLSVSRNSVEFNIDHSHLTYNQWMMYNNIWSNLQGFNVNRNITITQLYARTKNESNIEFEITNNNDMVYALKLENESYKTIDDLNIDINSNTSIKILLKITDSVVDYPTVKIEYAWR